MKNKRLGFRKRNVLIISMIIIVLALGGLTYYLLLPEKESELIYQTGKVKQGDIVLSLEGSGVIDYVNSTDLISTINGTISDLYISEGSQIEVGDPVLEIDNSDLKLQLDQLYNDLKIAELKLAELLHTTVDKIAQVDVEELSTVYAPSSGVVEYSLQEGAYVNNNSPVITIEDNEKVYFVFEANADDVGGIQIGQSVDINLTDYTESIIGTVSRINNPHSNGFSMVYDVYVLVDNPGMIVSGKEGTATILLASGTIEQLGKFVNSDQTKVYSKINGSIQELYVENGQYVNQGDPLFKIDNASLINSVQTQMVSIDNIKLKINDLEQQLARTVLKTEYAGTVSDLYVINNQTLNNNAKIATITSNQLVAKIEVDELDIGKISLGQTAEVYIPAYSNDPVTGKVVYIGDKGIVKDGITTYEIYIEVEAKEGIKSGMTVDASILLEKAENVLMVPTTSVIDIKGGKAVRILEGENIISKNVEIGMSNDTMTEIKSGLELNELIITSLTYTNSSSTTSTSTTNSSLMPSSVTVPGISSPGGGGGGYGK